MDSNKVMIIITETIIMITASQLCINCITLHYEINYIALRYNINKFNQMCCKCTLVDELYKIFECVLNKAL